MKSRAQGSKVKREKKVDRVKVLPVPLFVTCPRCGEEVELWSDGNETICYFCNYRPFRKEFTLH